MDRQRFVSILIGILVLVGLYVISVHNYLLFHSLAETFSIVVAYGIFMVVWNTRRFLDNNYLLVIGIAYLFVGSLDLLHTLGYKGMGVFKGYETNLATQLWIAARYMEGITLFVAPFSVGRRLRASLVFYLYVAVSLLLLGAIFSWEIFPPCFVEGIGLTLFKKISEYVICLILVASVILLLQKRNAFDKNVFRLLVASITLTIGSELAFTYYVHAYGLSNMVGHFAKIISFYLIYKAIMETSLVRPYSLVFRDLKASEESLRRARNLLEQRVKERTAELVIANEQLLQEIEERNQAQGAVKESEEKYSSLVENSLTGIYIIDEDGNIAFSNNRFAEIHGYLKDELLGTEYWRLFDPEDRAKARQICEKRLKGQNAPFEYQAKGLKKDGTTVWTIRRNTLIEFQGKPALLGNVADITPRKVIENRLRESEEELRQLSSHLLKAQETERKRIAQELHDGIGQSLSAIKFSVETMVQQTKHKTISPSVESFEGIIAVTQQAIEEVRAIVMNLRPSILDDLGILATIAWFCREYAAVYTGIRIEQRIGIREDAVPDHLKPIIYRVLQEAMNNVAKHSNANFVRVGVRKVDGKLELVLEDNGNGFNVRDALHECAAKKKFGLVSMKERIELSGGSHSIESTKGIGTIVRAAWVV